MRFKIVLVVALAIFASSGALAMAESGASDDGGGWEDYAPLTAGSYSVSNGELHGTLPPGTTTSDLPIDPTATAAEQQREADAMDEALNSDNPPVAADPSQDGVADSRTAGADQHHRHRRHHQRRVGRRGRRAHHENVATSRGQYGDKSKPDDGCVDVISSVSSIGIHYKGQMLGCARGNLEINTWLERNDHLISDTYIPNSCNNQTRCSTASGQYGGGDPRHARFTAVAHAMNHTTHRGVYVWQYYGER